MDETPKTSPPMTPQNTGGMLRLPKSAYTGTLLGLGTVVAINFLWFAGNLGFEGIHPHPFWLVVLPMAARYGFTAGLVSGTASGLALLGLQLLGGTLPSVERLLDLENLARPIFFVAGGILIGEIREAQKRRYLELAETHQALTSAHDDLVQRFEALNRAKQELDTHIISQEQTLTTVYEAAKGLKSLDEEAIFPAVVAIAVDFLSAEACAIYRLADNRLRLAASQQPESGFERRQELPVDEGMAGEAIISRRTVSLNAMTPSADFAALAAEGIIICVPLLNSKRQVLGLLTIEKLPFIKFNPQTVRLASIIGEWCGSAIENAITFKETLDKNISDDVTGAYTYTYFLKRLQEEFMRARRYGGALSLIVFEIEGFTEIDDGHRQDILTVLSLVFKNKLRTVDLFFHDQDASRYLIVLPGTPAAGALVVKHKIVEEIDAFKFRPYADETRQLAIHSGVAAFEDAMEKPDNLIEQAVNAIQ